MDPGLPAVVLPSGLKAARSFPSPSSVVEGRTPSSFSTVTVLSVPSASVTLVTTGTISASNRPLRWARSALRAEEGGGQKTWSLQERQVEEQQVQ